LGRDRQAPDHPQAELRAAPATFEHRDALPVLCSTTSGTTGHPTQVSFSARELHTITRFAALGHLLDGSIQPDDVVLNAMSSRAVLGNLSLASACEQIRALLQPVGLTDPALALALLSQPQPHPSHASRVSVLCTYPSYLGQLVEQGLAAGYGPADFGLRRLTVGGEVVTAGLLYRARRLFGHTLQIDTGYAMTETYPFAGMPCEQGNLHFEPSYGLVEVLDPATGRPCAPSEVGSLVVTPFPPFRETTLLLRYDTEDLVRAVASPLTCRHHQLPATSGILGKLPLSARHPEGWTSPADVLGALEGVDAVPLPARCGFWADGDGVAVEVVVRETGDAVRRTVVSALPRHGVPCTDLRLVTDASALRHPFPLRCDLRESRFASPSQRTAKERAA
jgi:phenylacetate-CoA ligase